MLIYPAPAWGKTDIPWYKGSDINLREFLVLLLTKLQCSSSEYRVLASFISILVPIFYHMCSATMFYHKTEMWQNSSLGDAWKKRLLPLLPWRSLLPVSLDEFSSCVLFFVFSLSPSHVCVHNTHTHTRPCLQSFSIVLWQHDSQKYSTDK